MNRRGFLATLLAPLLARVMSAKPTGAVCPAGHVGVAGLLGGVDFWITEERGRRFFNMRVVHLGQEIFADSSPYTGPLAPTMIIKEEHGQLADRRV